MGEKVTSIFKKRNEEKSSQINQNRKRWMKNEDESIIITCFLCYANN